MGRGQNTMGKVFNIPWVGDSTYHEQGVYMGRGFDIPWVEGQHTIGKGFDIPWIGGVI